MVVSDRLTVHRGVVFADAAFNVFAKVWDHQKCPASRAEVGVGCSNL